MPGAPFRPAGATPARIEIPRWIQLVGLPLLLVLVWVLAGAVRHVVFLFLVALLIALLLNPLVRGLGKVWIPRGLAVAIVYLTFAAAVALAVIALATVVVQQTRHASHRVDNYFTVDSGRLHQTGAEHDLTRLQHWLDTHHLKRIRVQGQGTKFLNSVGTKDVQKYTTKTLTWAEGAGLAVVGLLFSIVLVIVVSVYMLLDMHRLAAAVDRRFPPHPDSPPLIERMERALASYVRGQLLLSLIIGASAGIGLWALGMVGLMPNGGRYALVFGVWAGVTELIPYIGPWLGAAPPVLYALIQHPLAALWVALLFLGIQQLEGHVVVPKVMGHSLRLHPLLVIFGLLAGGEIYGFPGILVALPLLAAGRAAWEFFGERVELARWTADQPVAEATGVDLTPAAPERPAASAQ
ncbi:MAG TPA: AI-2E family transporter [Gaiellaceae bacterium]|nr:AI-2E family transporter [Gaiellaceae bacterium]